MSIVNNGTPQNVKYGVDDRSVPDLIPTRAGKPIHLPLMFTFAPMGDTDNAYVLSGDNLKKMCGDEILDFKSPYATFNTPFLALFNSLANESMVQRVVPEDASEASMRLYAETYVAQVDVYERNPDNSVVYNSDGTPKVTGKQAGKVIIWHFGQINPASGLFGAGRSFAGEITGSDGNASVIQPILDFKAPYAGGKVNDFGLRLACPNAKSQNAVNPDMSHQAGARIVEMQWVDLKIDGMSPSIVKSIKGETSIQFCFKHGAFYQPTRREMDYRYIIKDSYRNMNPQPGFLPVLGQFKDLHVYHENMEAVGQAALDSIGDESLTNPYMVDIFTGLDVYGNPYNGVVVDDGTEGGEVLTMDHTHYYVGGSDGTMNNESFDLAVRKHMVEYGEGAVNYFNILKYPNSWLWDSGFTTDTKEQMCNFIGRAKHTNLVLSTHVYNQPANDMATEDAMKLALSSMLRSFPESSKYGTPCMRGHIVGHSYLLSNSQWKERTPVTYSLAAMLSAYAGSGQGRFVSRNKFTRGELAIVDHGYDINLTYKPFTGYMSDWEAGLISLRSFDQTRYHFPAIYTVYNEDRSILNNFIVSTVIGDLEYLTEETWAEMSGVSDMTDDQVAQEVVRKMVRKTTNRYDGVVDLDFQAYFTEEDKNNGYSITLDVHVYGAVMKTVFKTTIVAHRFQQAA